MTPNLVCMFLAMSWSAEFKNHNSTLCTFRVIPLWYFLLVRSVTPPFMSRARQLNRMHGRLVIRRVWVRGSGPATFFRWDWSWNLFYGHSLPSADSRREVVSYLRKNVHWVLVNRLIDLSLPRKSVVRLTDRPNMTLAVDRGR